MSDGDVHKESQKLTGDHIATLGLTDWRTLQSKLHARFRTGNFATGLQMVDAIGAAAEEANHHPDLDLRYTHVDVRLWSHDARGVTQRDVRLARAVSAIAADAGVSLTHTGVARLELALDSPDFAAVLPFWFHRDASGRYRLRVEPTWDGWPSGDPAQDAARYMAELEAVVRQHPEQYLWVHRRFKTRPPGEPDLYR